MATITETVELSAAPEQVWEKIARLDNYTDWLTIHVDFPDGAPDELQPDATFREKVRIMGMPGDVKWKVEECDQPSRLVLKGEGPMGTKMSTTFSLESVNGGTTLRYESEFGGAALAPMAAQLEKASKESAAESMEKLRELLG
jgi:uncharacterized protein YndB with AHSA1/START domain